MTADASSALDKGEILLLSLADTLSAASDLLQTATDDLRAVRAQTDESLSSTIDGLLDVLDKAANTDSADKLESAAGSIHSALDDAETDLEEQTNVLNIDAEATCSP